MQPSFHLENIPGRGIGVIADVDLPAGVDILVSAGVVVPDGDFTLYCGFCLSSAKDFDEHFLLCSDCLSVSYCSGCIKDMRVKALHEKECTALRDLTEKETITKRNLTQFVRDTENNPSEFMFYVPPDVNQASEDGHAISTSLESGQAAHLSDHVIPQKPESILMSPCSSSDPHFPLPENYGTVGKCKCENCNNGCSDFHMICDNNLKLYSSQLLREPVLSKPFPRPTKVVDAEIYARTKNEDTSLLRLLIRVLAHRKVEMDELGFSRRRRKLPSTISEWHIHQHRAVAQLFGTDPDRISASKKEDALTTVQNALFLLGSSARCNKDECLTLLMKLYANTLPVFDPNRYQTYPSKHLLNSSLDSTILGFDSCTLTGPLCTLGLGIFPEASRFNHSCDPNCTYLFNPTPHPALSIRAFSPSTPSVTIRTIRPVKKGEELCISYIDPILENKVRRTVLQEVYSFDCVCPRCILWTEQSCAREAAQHLSCVTIPKAMTPNSEHIYRDRGALLTNPCHGVSAENLEDMKRQIHALSLGWTLYRPYQPLDAVLRGYYCSCGAVVSISSLQYAKQHITQGTFHFCGDLGTNNRIKDSSSLLIPPSPSHDSSESKAKTNDILLQSGKTVFWPKYKDVFLKELLMMEYNIESFLETLHALRANLFAALGLGGIFSSADMEEVYRQAYKIAVPSCSLDLTKIDLMELDMILSSHTTLQDARASLFSVMVFFLYSLKSYSSQHLTDQVLLKKMLSIVQPILNTIWTFAKASLQQAISMQGLVSSLYNSYFTRVFAALDQIVDKSLKLRANIMDRTKSKEIGQDVADCLDTTIPWLHLIPQIQKMLAIINRINSSFQYYPLTLSQTSLDGEVVKHLKLSDGEFSTQERVEDSKIPSIQGNESLDESQLDNPTGIHVKSANTGHLVLTNDEVNFIRSTLVELLAMPIPPLVNFPN